mmetsp:Transcript_108858/g.273899  ORF Transcript_108858/g.273899 Transcript_108858/m.273899 type:complete len:282 (-) Transcript_108858:3716-4561(-)
MALGQVLLALALLHAADVRNDRGHVGRVWLGARCRSCRSGTSSTTAEGTGFAHAVLEAGGPLAVVPRAAKCPLAATHAMALAFAELPIVCAATLGGRMQQSVTMELVGPPLANIDLPTWPSHLALAFAPTPDDLPFVGAAALPLLARVPSEEHRLLPHLGTDLDLVVLVCSRGNCHCACRRGPLLRCINGQRPRLGGLRRQCWQGDRAGVTQGIDPRQSVGTTPSGAAEALQGGRPGHLLGADLRLCSSLLSDPPEADGRAHNHEEEAPDAEANAQSGDEG